MTGRHRGGVLGRVGVRECGQVAHTISYQKELSLVPPTSFAQKGFVLHRTGEDSEVGGRQSALLPRES